MSDAYKQGDFDYFDCWLNGFIAPGGNEEKFNTAASLKVFIESLAAQNYIFTGNRPVHEFEFGIGDASSTIQFLTTLLSVHKPGFVISGCDIEEEQLARAGENLSGLFNDKVQIGNLILADACAPALTTEQPADFGFGSHFLYLIKHRYNGMDNAEERIDADFTQFVRNIDRLVRPDGITLMYHDGYTSEIYGPDGIGGRFGESMTDAPERLARIAEREGFFVRSAEIESRLYFPDLAPSVVMSFEDIRNWTRAAEETEEAEWLRKFLFSLDIFPVRDETGNEIRAGGARRLAETGQLAEAVRGMNTLLAENGGYINMHAQMQAFAKDPATAPKLDIAFNAVREKLPAIRQETALKMNRSMPNP